MVEEKSNWPSENTKQKHVCVSNEEQTRKTISTFKTDAGMCVKKKLKNTESIS